MHAVRPPLVSEAEFLSLPESMDKMELLDGEVVIARRRARGTKRSCCESSLR